MRQFSEQFNSGYVSVGQSFVKGLSLKTKSESFNARYANVHMFATKICKINIAYVYNGEICDVHEWNNSRKQQPEFEFQMFILQG